MVHYRTSSDSGEPPGSTFLTLVKVGSLQTRNSYLYPTISDRVEPPGSTILSLVTVCVTRVHYLTSSDSGKIQVFLFLPLVAVGCHQVLSYF